MAKPETSSVTTTEMTTPSKSTIITTEMTTPSTSTMTTSQITTSSTSAMTTKEMKTPATFVMATISSDRTVITILEKTRGHFYLSVQYSVNMNAFVPAKKLEKFASECYCGDSLDDQTIYQKNNEKDCRYACSGNSSAICGGAWRNSVYVCKFDPLGAGERTLKLHDLKSAGQVILITATVSTTKMTPTHGHSTVKTTEMTTTRQSTVITTEVPTLGQSEVTTTDLITPGKSPVTTLQKTTPGASKVTTMKTTTLLGKSEVTFVQKTSLLECICPCSKVGKRQVGFLTWNESYSRSIKRNIEARIRLNEQRTEYQQIQYNRDASFQDIRSR
ncbi:unnamed protein product [Mytilus coruscus]|uniref:WSC domain-containing protein n=1 Tax=Mytilus coruscus TaxID=42192 RepID=A0A6J8F1E6_MYTCO|nr:unnamed protein product [Mytilus coruscus]